MKGISRHTRTINIGGVEIGGGNKIAIQSMTTIKTSQTDRVCAQIADLEKAGCDIIRVSVLDEEDARAISEIKKNIHIPLVADIHYSARLACLSVESGADKIRLNPGNIGSKGNIQKVAACLNEHKIPIRIGANTGSIKKEFLQKYGRGAKALVYSALDDVQILRDEGVEDIVISVKSSSVPECVQAYSMLSEMTDCPLHLGVTEAGVERYALTKSACAFAPLLLNGIGDTIRVSISGDPIREIYAAKDILRALEIDKNFVNVISCPTCGRCRWDPVTLAQIVQDKVEGIEKQLTIAVMGCDVNGPGEAKEADLGIAGGDGYCLIFKNGIPMRKVECSSAKDEFLKELDNLLNG